MNALNARHELTQRGPRFVFEAGDDDADDGAVPRPFDLSRLDAAGAAVVRCWYHRQTLWCRREEEPEIAIAGTGEVTLCAKVDLETGAVSLGLTPAVGAPDPDYYVAPLYVLSRESEDDPWRVDADVRPQPLVVGWI